MDTIWSFRNAYETARLSKKKQDDFCEKALKGEWEGLGDFPEDLQWEALVDVLRGRVKVLIDYSRVIMMLTDYDRFTTTAMKLLIWTEWFAYVSRASFLAAVYRIFHS